MGLVELLQKTAEFIQDKWYEREAYEEDPRVYSMPMQMEEYARLMFPPKKIGMTIEDIKPARITQEEAFERIDANVPDSPRVQLVDFCSSTGVRFTHGFAQKHPQADVILVDQIRPEDIGNYMFTELFAQAMKEQGKTDEEIKLLPTLKQYVQYDTEVQYQGDMPKFMQSLFEANGRNNMHYSHKRLDGSHNQIATEIDSHKTLHVTGWRCPRDAGIHAIQQSIINKAESITMTFSALERMTMAQRLSKGSAIISNNWEELMTKMIHRPDEKCRYHYQHPRDRQLGYALKQIKTIDILMWVQEHGYQAELYTLQNPQMYNFNQPEHIINAYKTQNPLRKD